MSSLKEYADKLDSADEAERVYAAEDIGYLNGPEGVLALLSRVGHEPSRAVRDAIFQALIRIDADASIEGSIQLLGSQDAQIRNQAVDVLRRKGARSIPFLNGIMRSGDKHMRKLVLDALSGIQADGAGEIYAAALSDPDPNVVITAVENIGSVRAPEFRRRIEELLRADAHPMLIVACMEALAGIGNESSLAAIRRTFPVFSALPDFMLASCLKAVAALGSDKEFAEVASLLPQRGRQLRPAILSALLAICPKCQTADACQELCVALREVVQSEDPPMARYQAVRVLGCWAAMDEIFELLVSCLADSERLVRLGAVQALRSSGRPEVESLLASRALEETDEEVFQALTC